jgi:hypothetical protein
VLARPKAAHQYEQAGGGGGGQRGTEPRDMHVCELVSSRSTNRARCCWYGTVGLQTVQYLRWCTGTSAAYVQRTQYYRLASGRRYYYFVAHHHHERVDNNYCRQAALPTTARLPETSNLTTGESVAWVGRRSWSVVTLFRAGPPQHGPPHSP